ncbi:MAG: sporulation transcriptional regulator SpoIIID [Anaerosporomusa subterranea]|jgi:putative DeoR family transcriptional regulator (stage III sporulation protein D)|nr:sporulation transcriptional regulator SpoIIID [Anaerosporomusa subterranea]
MDVRANNADGLLSAPRREFLHLLDFVRIYINKNGQGGTEKVKDYIRKRVLDIGRHILDSKHTVRQAAGVFGVSKSTVHKDMIERLPSINENMANQVKQVLDLNKAERHIRGGEATRKKYKHDKDADEN